MSQSDARVNTAVNLLRVLGVLEMTGHDLFEALTIGEQWTGKTKEKRRLSAHISSMLMRNHGKSLMLMRIAPVLGVPLHDLLTEDFSALPAEDLRARYDLDRAKVLERATWFAL